MHKIWKRKFEDQDYKEFTQFLIDNLFTTTTIDEENYEIFLCTVIARMRKISCQTD